MRAAAPAVDYPASQGGFWRRIGAALGGVVGAVPAAWASSHLALQPGLPVGSGGLALFMLLGLGLGAWAGWRWSRVPACSLYWDGGRWQRRGPAGDALDAGVPELALDWGDWLLLRWRRDPSAAGDGAGARHDAFIPLARRDLPSRWHLLRVALRQCPRGGDTP
ncbi:MAG TPA: hypothetical protein VLA16_10980 [Ideonella sp.]|nr:hypothetical protein [Ideonella sp.]